MKREDIKKRLISQSENLIPDMKDSILDKIDKVEILPYHKVEKTKTHKRFMVRKVLTAVGLSLILVISGVIGFVLHNDHNRPTNDSYIYISINPKVELVSDNDNQVKSARGLNKDGILLLAGENLVGMDTNSACRRVVTLASRMGYLSNGKKVSISVVSSNTENETRVESLIKEEFINEVDINLELASENANEDIESIAKEKNVSVNKVILAKTAMEIDPDLTIDNALLLSTSRLLELVSDYDEGLLDNISDYVLDLYEDNEELKAIDEEIVSKEKEIEDFTAEIDSILDDFDEEKAIEYILEKELSGIIASDFYEEGYIESELKEYKESRLLELNKELEELNNQKNEIIDNLKLEIKEKINEEVIEPVSEEENQEEIPEEVQEEVEQSLEEENSEEITNKNE